MLEDSVVLWSQNIFDYCYICKCLVKFGIEVIVFYIVVSYDGNMFIFDYVWEDCQ